MAWTTLPVIRRNSSGYRCAICGVHINNSRFPYDYPKEFRVCCLCLDLIEYLVQPTNRMTEHVEVCPQCQEILNINREKIIKIVTLVGKND